MKKIQNWQFTDLESLRNFLNGFKETELSTIWADETHNGVNLQIVERDLSDESKVADFKFFMI